MIKMLVSVCLIVGLSFGFHHWIGNVDHIPSSSMSPALYTGDYVWFNRIVYRFHPIYRGDVVVIRPNEPHSFYYIKRVIGVGGDCISLDKGSVIRNGQLIDRPRDHVLDFGSFSLSGWTEQADNGLSYSVLAPSAGLGPYDTMGKVCIPEGKIFVMGDNRENSADSRVPRSLHGLGLVDRSEVFGRVSYVLWGHVHYEDYEIWRFFKSITPKL